MTGWSRWSHCFKTQYIWDENLKSLVTESSKFPHQTWHPSLKLWFSFQKEESVLYNKGAQSFLLLSTAVMQRGLFTSKLALLQLLAHLVKRMSSVEKTEQLYLTWEQQEEEICECEFNKIFNTFLSFARDSTTRDNNCSSRLTKETYANGPSPFLSPAVSHSTMFFHSLMKNPSGSESFCSAERPPLLWCSC